MSKLLKPEEYIRIWIKRYKAKRKAERVCQHWDEKYKLITDDWRKYNEIIYRASSEYLKFRAAGYERMLKITSHKISKNKVIITADSIEIIFPDTCIIRDDLTIEYPLTDDCELLSWDYEKFGFNGFKGVYDVSDWLSFLMKGLRCKDIKTIK